MGLPGWARSPVRLSPTVYPTRYVFICNAMDGSALFGHKNYREHWHISKGEHHGEIL
jgi:hypothetical protein